ncbi:carbohydrate ABC transporter permease [Fictibacillus sp. WQ 8-8]|uniref:carbohydrate ABC transporter permease n=1 Tax=unclassified Fictibacillus TaxID=2644029 RepID=UPI000783295A|nr:MULTISPECIES: carbohydrate ABC transporter permease [unclassified Fictibacillus]MCQ6267927.1 carbohydrate ABC transporter permease [Fictibacillus sp. WQ 8-8]MED2974406.1 carbohydrate ABC transporter permease [Fictibacillus sp. B-59209]
MSTSVIHKAKNHDKKKLKASKIIGQLIVYSLLILGAIVMLIPFFWMVSASLKESWQVFSFPPKWLPDPIRWDNYVTTFQSLPFGKWLGNTVIITVSTIIGTLLSCTVVAYGFARFRAKGKNVLFLVMLATMMLPTAVTMIPVFYLFKSLGWINTFLPLIVPAFFGNAFFIFLLRQFYMSIPTELEDAAKIDGLGTLGILWKIIVPLTMPALITVAIFQFNGAWNDFMGPLLYLSKPDLYTLALGINFFKSQNDVQWNYLMAASVVTMLPSLILFFVGQKYFIEGISLSGGVKG